MRDCLTGEEEDSMHKAGKWIVALAIAIFILLAVFLMGRFGWRLGGFSACQSAEIESVTVEADAVRIQGFCPGSFPEGFCGYYARQSGSRLFVGFRFSGVFGFFETGDFDIFIPIKGEITEVIMKSSSNEYTIWNQEENHHEG